MRMVSLNRDRLPGRIRLLSWLNIDVQAIFPLAAAFTPSIAGAGSDWRFLPDSAHAQLLTRTHTLGSGDELDALPLAPLSAPAKDGEARDQFVAGFASRAGSFLGPATTTSMKESILSALPVPRPIGSGRICNTDPAYGNGLMKKYLLIILLDGLVLSLFILARRRHDGYGFSHGARR